MIVLILVFISFILIAYLCPDGLCAINSWSLPEQHFRRRTVNSIIKDNLGQSLSESSHPLNHYKLSFDDMINAKEFVFDIKGNDVMVFLHIQKTGIL